MSAIHAAREDGSSLRATWFRLVLLPWVSVLAIACGSDDSPDTAPPPEVFMGTVDAFYAVPDPLPEGEPGQLIRIQHVSDSGDSTTLRIMYHSRDARDRDRAVTGMLTYPHAAPPAGGWPVVSLANGTVGLVSQCALSRRGRAAPTFGVEGVGVVTDYIGLGPIGETHPYLSRLSEAHSVVDAVRAARNLSESGAGSRWLAIGHSQGGHAALATNELAADYAPELELLGTISLEPAALFERTYDGIDPIVAHVVGVMLFYGAASEHPEIMPDEYVSAAGADAASVIEDNCLDEIINSVLTVPVEDFYVYHPIDTEPARSILLANDVGGLRAESPLLLIGGTADQTVVIDRVRDLLDELCAADQVTEYVEIEGATHETEYALAAEQIEDWFAARLNGDPVIDACAE